MKLTYLYQPVADPESAAEHYAAIGFEEAWRDGERTVSVWLPDRTAQIMLSTTDQPAGPMFGVDLLDEWIDANPDVLMVVDRYDIPGGAVAGFRGPEGHVYYVFDQALR